MKPRNNNSQIIKTTKNGNETVGQKVRDTLTRLTTIVITNYDIYRNISVI